MVSIRSGLRGLQRSAVPIERSVSPAQDLHLGSSSLSHLPALIWILRWMADLGSKVRWIGWGHWVAGRALRLASGVESRAASPLAVAWRRFYVYKGIFGGCRLCATGWVAVFSWRSAAGVEQLDITWKDGRYSSCKESIVLGRGVRDVDKRGASEAVVCDAIARVGAARRQG